MLLQQIVEVLDAELARLDALRSVVNGLSGTVDLAVKEPVRAIAEVAPVIEAQLPMVADHAPVTRSVRKPRERTTTVPRAKGTAAEAKALTSVIPATPVVITKAALAKEHAAKRDQRSNTKAAEPAPEPGSLAYMIRALHLDASA